jgi:IS30 family transposase
MSQEYNNIIARKFKQIKFRDRIIIEALRKQGQVASKIAEVLDFTKRSINREIKRGMVYGLRNSDETTRDEYSADAAQRNANFKGSKQRS